jgi:hypothetical protein
MKRCIWTLSVILIVGASTAIAQPPGGGGPGGPRGRSPIMEALDADRDGVISAEEIKNATAALVSLDKNKDGKLSEDEFRPTGPGGEGRGPGGEGRGPGGEGRGPGGEGRGPGGEGRGPGGEGRGPGGQGRGPGGQALAINPDRMMMHAMEFDADKDGKLSKDELQKFIGDFFHRHSDQLGGPMGPGGPSGGREGGPGRGREGGPGRGREGGPGSGREGGRGPEGGPEGGERPRRPDPQS